MTDRLKCNFNMNDSLPGFFIHGGYAILDRAKAESQYCDSVRALTECEMLECQNWALNILASDFMPLKHQDSFWLNKVFRTNLIREFINAEETRFIVSTPANYHQTAPHHHKRMLEPEAERVLRPRINIKEDDGIMLDGLD
ncbi:hypothetical protein G6F46_004379 [Rhizopus delemar]|uniref:Uncharacterized protein n=2 Tax=Rhizopus TaxID=4842 RepID=A0A9P6YZ48_9FUNG|nr:hypothetical protein G6F36_011640 [Rhizopus arrhizus]KAG1453977.1 hypothetical protein G6F55_007849 [Rhizopus delemar]KAG1493712.1 hypothetical protein G6F54_008385 [Rhizopus delemar]KAG1514068.1 hypothetical protein G6F53_003960 [Rhizopus delemar]KAG1522942.1 hypothetical protein G6F52_005429 [Rhizopus delemar]